MASASFNGRERHLRRFGGASATRVSHMPGNVIAEHQHDWLNITVQLLGACDEDAGMGAFRLDGPSVTILPAGSHHANRIGRHGLETIGFLLDPAWLGGEGIALSPDRPLNARGGSLGIAARQLAGLWMSEGVSEAELASATAKFLARTHHSEPVQPPTWLEGIMSLLNTEPSIGTEALARRLNRHPAWLARAYRHAVGEGIVDTIRRRRVERALCALRGTDTPLAQVALEAGFCDQSHMNRCFVVTLGQTPFSVRAADT